MGRKVFGPNPVIFSPTHIVGSYPDTGSLPTTGVSPGNLATVGSTLYRWNGSTWSQVSYTPRIYADLLISAIG